MIPQLKTVIDPGAWLVASGLTLLAGAPGLVFPDLAPEFPTRVILGGLLGALVGQAFLPAASLWRGLLAVVGGLGFALMAEPHASAALSKWFGWPAQPFATAAVLGMVAPALVPAVVSGVPSLWARLSGSKADGGGRGGG